MLLQSFVLHFDSAPPSARAEAAALIARTYLYGELSPDDLRQAEAAMTLAADDASPSVRQSLAEILAHSPRAPRHIVSALIFDQPDIAALVLARSPLISDAELAERAALNEELPRYAIAIRPNLPASVAGVLAAQAGQAAVAALLRNGSAEISAAGLETIAARFALDGGMREALLQHGNLSPGLRQRLAAATAAALLSFTAGCGWISPARGERLAQETLDKAALAVAAEPGQAEIVAYVHALRQQSRLTAALLLRSLCCGQRAVYAAALSILSGIAHERVAGLMRNHGRAPLAALYVRAGLPDALAPVFAAAIDALHIHRVPFESAGADVQLPLIRTVISACKATAPPNAISLLYKLEVEAALASARLVAATAVSAAEAPAGIEELAFVEDVAVLQSLPPADDQPVAEAIPAIADLQRVEDIQFSALEAGLTSVPELPTEPQSGCDTLAVGSANLFNHSTLEENADAEYQLASAATVVPSLPVIIAAARPAVEIPSASSPELVKPSAEAKTETETESAVQSLPKLPAAPRQRTAVDVAFDLWFARKAA